MVGCAAKAHSDDLPGSSTPGVARLGQFSEPETLPLGQPGRAADRGRVSAAPAIVAGHLAFRVRHQSRAPGRTAEPRSIRARLPRGSADRRRLARVRRGAPWAGLSAVPEAHAWPRLVLRWVSLALHAAGLLGFTAPRCETQARVAHLLLQYAGRLESGLGRSDAHSR